MLYDVPACGFFISSYLVIFLTKYYVPSLDYRIDHKSTKGLVANRFNEKSKNNIEDPLV